ncbi:MAG: c-type cytochrome, partial [Myxococcales bacterium]|nr:c-type cytochrome [Myxococcales bacterium]
MAALIRNPADERIYGGTKHDTMEPLPKEELDDEGLAAITEYVYGLMGPGATNVDQALFAKGKALYDDELECSGCHELEGQSVGPALQGRGSLRWLERVIASSGQPDLYIDTAEMPKFEGKIDDADIQELALLIYRQRLVAEGIEGEAAEAV